MKFAICDDEQVYLEQMRNLVQEWCDDIGGVCTIDKFHSGEEILKIIRDEEYDLIILDISMPKIHGFDVAKEIHKITGGDNLLFATFFEDFVYQTFDFRPVGFVRKTNLDDELKRELNKWYKCYGMRKIIPIRYGHYKDEVNLRSDKIMYIEARGHYVDFYLHGGVYDERASISKYDFLLESREFVKCNRSTICNMRFVLSRKDECFVLCDGTKISVGRTYRREAWEKYKKYTKYECLGE
ncbi:MAG: response regulator transcription factor [Lachnospira sp.]|nr:response regulator transcription factor [Lachnospira sp.]